VPYSSFDKGLRTPIDVISFIRPPEQDIYKIVNILETNLGRSLASYDIAEYSEISGMSHQYSNLFIFIAGLVSILLTAMFVFRYSINTVKIIKEKADLYYPKQLFKVERRRIIINAAVILMCCIITVGIIYIIRFKFIVPDRYIPYDNIFDIKFFMDNIISDIHAAALSSDSFVSILSYKQNLFMKIEMFCVVLISILFIAAAMFFRLLTRMDTKLPRVLKASFFAIFSGAAAGLGISAFLGIEFFLPVKSMIILLYFFFIRGCYGIKNNI
jgi:putative ABC transport system permease protein